YFESRIGSDAGLVAYIDLATFHRNGLDFAAAEQVLRDASGRFPDNAVVWNELGRTYGGEGRYDAALDAFTEGLRIAPEAPTLLRGASLAELRLGRLDSAHALAVKLTSREEADASDHMWLASIEEARGNQNTAISSYE